MYFQDFHWIVLFKTMVTTCLIRCHHFLSIQYSKNSAFPPIWLTILAVPEMWCIIQAKMVGRMVSHTFTMIMFRISEKFFNAKKKIDRMRYSVKPLKFCALFSITFWICSPFISCPTLKPLCHFETNLTGIIYLFKVFKK